MTKILVLGGTRYVGSSLCTLLRREDPQHDVRTLSRNDTPADHHSHFVCDRKDQSRLYEVFETFRPEIVIDMVNFEKDDSEGIVLAHQHGLLSQTYHYITVSSFFVYNYFEHAKFRERWIDLPLPSVEMDGYTRRKIEMEHVLSKSPLRDISTVFRFPFIFSSDDYSGRFQKLCQLAISSKNPDTFPAHRFSMVSRSAAALALSEAAVREPLGIVDFADRGCASIPELCDAIARIEKPGKSSGDISVPYSVAHDICITTEKMETAENLAVAIEREARDYFSSV